MGIDVYLRYVGMDQVERDAQITGFKIDKGDVGYLREAYHGEPYATKALVPETWGEKWEVPLPEGDGQDAKVTLAEMGVRVVQIPNPDFGKYEDEPEFGEYVHVPATVLRQRLATAIAAAHERGRIVYKDPTGHPEMARSLEEFVKLAERWESEGKQTYIINSY